MNWNWPGETSETPLIRVQFVGGSDAFVVVKTPNNAPTVLVKENWNQPLVNFAGRMMAGLVGTGTLMAKMLLVLGIPLTNTVANAWPGGNPHTGIETNKLLDQVVAFRNVAVPLGMLRNCTTG